MEIKSQERFNISIGAPVKHPLDPV